MSPLRSALFLLASLGPALAFGCRTSPARPSAPAVTPASEAVLLRLRYHAGDAQRSVIAMDTYLHMGPGEPPAGDSARPMMHVTMFATESVTAVSGDTFTIAQIADSSRLAAPGFDLPMPSPDSLGARGLMRTMQVTSRGRVLSVQLERAAQVEGRAAILRTMLRGIDSSGTLDRGEGPILPDHPVHAGETWADTAPCPPALRACEGGVVTAYRLERFEGGAGQRIAVISGRTALPEMTLQQPMEVTMGPTHVVAQARFDLGAGRIIERSITMNTVTRSQMGDMSMRMEMRQTTLPAAAGVGAGAARPPTPPPMPPGFLMRPANLPTPTTLDSLIALFRHFEPTLQFQDCSLPDVAPGADWITLPGPDDGLHVRLPPGWRAAAMDTTPRGDPEAVLRDSVSNRILITRNTRASGLPHLMKSQSYGRPIELPTTGRCRLGVGTAGSVWTLYAPDPEATSGPFSTYNAMGDLITAAGNRYDVSVRAASAEVRDRIVRILADAVRPPH